MFEYVLIDGNGGIDTATVAIIEETLEILRATDDFYSTFQNTELVILEPGIHL